MPTLLVDFCIFFLFYVPGGVHWNFQLGPGSGQNEPRDPAVARRAQQRRPHQKRQGNLRRQRGCQPADALHYQFPGRRLRKGKRACHMSFEK